MSMASMSIRHTSPARLGRLPACAAVSLALVGALVGCGGGAAAAGGTVTASGTGAVPAAGAAAGSVQQQARTVWLDYARCVRAHGHPTFPDPQVDAQGQPDFGRSIQAKLAANQAQAACGAILDRLPASVRGGGPVTPGQLHEEMLFAACMREHGLPQWPDPKPDGSFPLSGTPYANIGKTGPVRTGLAACNKYVDFGGMRVS